MDTQQLAGRIIDEVGGKDNIREVFHCVTRLRFYVNDLGKVDQAKLKALPGVLGVVNQTGQLQVIIGNEVDTVCAAVQQRLGMAVTGSAMGGSDTADDSAAGVDSKAKLAGDVQANKQKMRRFRVGGIFETISAIILPIIPALAGTGILKGVLTIMTSYLGFQAESDIVKLLTICSDVVFYFLPFFIAWSAAKRFKTDTAMALVLAGFMLYPTMTAGLADSASPMHLFGLPIPFVKYAASSIPIILSVWVLKYVYAFVDKWMPKPLRLVFTPLVVALIMCPVTLGITGPIANYLSIGIAWLFKYLFTVSPALAGLVIGATRSLLVFTGMHLSLGAVIMQNLAQYGTDPILPVNTMGTLAIVGCCFGVWVCAKKRQNKEIGMSTFISSFIGITEPGIYGVLMVFRNALIADIIAGGVAGAFVAYFGGTTTAYVNSCILSLPVFVGPGFVYVCIGMGIAFVLGAGLTILFGIDEGDGARVDFSKLFSKRKAAKAAATVSAGETTGTATATVASAKTDAAKPADAPAAVPSATTVVTVSSPLTGDIVPLEQVEDKVFASGTLGKGIAVKPTEGLVVAPFDGTVTALYPSKHAVGVTSDSGLDLLIHIGIDTVQLGGNGFTTKVEQGQRVTVGQPLVEFDIASIKAAGYPITTPILVTNSGDWADVFPLEQSGAVTRGEALLKVLK